MSSTINEILWNLQIWPVLYKSKTRIKTDMTNWNHTRPAVNSWLTITIVDAFFGIRNPYVFPPPNSLGYHQGEVLAGSRASVMIILSLSYHRIPFATRIRSYIVFLVKAILLPVELIGLTEFVRQSSISSNKSETSSKPCLVAWERERIHWILYASRNWRYTRMIQINVSFSSWKKYSPLLLVRGIYYFIFSW